VNIFRRRKPKVLVIGLDSTPPRLLFEEFRDELSNLRELMDTGVFAPLRTIHPPITIPAWMAMCTGMDAGEMGVYGFRSRDNHSYTEYTLSMSHVFSGVRKIWDEIAERGKKSILVGIPPSYPPYPVNGSMISCFLCVDASMDYTYPSTLKAEIESLVGEYVFDVVFRTEERDTLVDQAFEMTEKRFKVIEHLLKEKEWDFFMFVEIGVDRIQHAFWKYYDPEHPLHEPNHRYKDVIPNYYKLLDEGIGRLLSALDKHTTVLLVSDHGAKAMKGAFCINEWLIEKGYLVLKSYPKEVVSFDKLDVDWAATRAWGWGGYYGRIFINKKGREPQGIVDEGEYERLRDELIEALETERDKRGQRWRTKVYRPEELYSNPQGNPSDLMAYFDDLSYRSAGTVGHKKLFLDENDTGPDDAVHDWEGVFVRWDSDVQDGLDADLNDLSVLDIHKIVLEILNR
jgi:predicted AlkP superfamily phosphohydrolase/phosphomutase